jgi:hypothetical protein
LLSLSTAEIYQQAPSWVWRNWLIFSHPSEENLWQLKRADH